MPMSEYRLNLEWVKKEGKIKMCRFDTRFLSPRVTRAPQGLGVDWHVQQRRLACC